MYGLGEVMHHPDPLEGFLRCLDRWESLVKPIDNVSLKRSSDAQLRNTLKVLARRALDFPEAHGTPVPPRIKDGPEAYRRWYDFWVVRMRNYGMVLKLWKSAKGDDRDRLLVEMAATGHPHTLKQITHAKLGPVELEALTTLGAAVGYEEKDPPEVGADRRAIGMYLNQISLWLTSRGGFW